MKINIEEFASVGQNRARAWFDTVFNQLLRNLGFEKEKLFLHTYGYDPHFGHCKNIKIVRRWIDDQFVENLDDILSTSKVLTSLIEEHDQLVRELSEYLGLLYEELRTDPKIKKCIDDMVYEMKQYKSLSSDDVSALKDLLYRYEENKDDVIDSMIEYTLNNLPELSKRHIYYILYKWNENQIQKTIQENLVTGEKYKAKYEYLVGVRQKLLESCTELQNGLNLIRRELSVKLDVPLKVAS